MKDQPGMRLNKSDTSIKFNRGITMQLTVHPAETLSRDHLEVDTLVTILSVDKMRQFHRVELQRSVVIR